MQKLIEKIAQGKFKVTTSGVTGSELQLDFNPIIEEFGLKGNFTLIHWQARPKGYRQWGIYTSQDDTYRTMAQLKINFATVQSLQLDDVTAKSIPSAVLYCQEDKVTCINQKTVIGDVLLSDVA